MTTDKPATAENYSPGLEGVIAGETAISTVETGLTYRGYAIEDLAEHSDYEEVAYLILYGELPTAEEAAAFRQLLRDRDLEHPRIAAWCHVLWNAGLLARA